MSEAKEVLYQCRAGGQDRYSPNPRSRRKRRRRGAASAASVTVEWSPTAAALTATFTWVTWVAPGKKLTMLTCGQDSFWLVCACNLATHCLGLLLSNHNGHQWLTFVVCTFSCAWHCNDFNWMKISLDIGISFGCLEPQPSFNWWGEKKTDILV